MIFLESPRVKGYVETSRSIVLDYDVKINPLKVSDRILNYGSLGNYSLAGFEMILHRYVSHYIITYYLPSGMNESAHCVVNRDIFGHCIKTLYFVRCRSNK